MRLISLYIKEYKLLKEFNIDFKKQISILIGINGSGKSSILETIAQIFSDAILNNEAKFGFKIIYQLRLDEIIEQTATASEFRTDYPTIEISASGPSQQLSYVVNTVDIITKKEIKIEKREDIEKRFNHFSMILPSNIVIYYSGLSDLMKNICEPHDNILSKLYREGNTNTNRPFFYFEPKLFDIILISLLSYEFGDIPEFLLDRAKIKWLQSVQIRLKKPTWAKGKINTWWGSKGETKIFLDYLSSISGNLEIDQSSSSNAKGNVILEAIDNDFINITIIDKQKLFEIRDHFIEEKALFKILNTLVIDGLLDDVYFSFINQDGNAFSLLSEGEQQAITIRGLTELVTSENSLFLLDEPDTYLHPSWQKYFIETIVQFTEKSEGPISQFLITTHSPQLLSNANPEKSEVQIMEDGEIVKITPKYYGKDISTILYEIMGVERRNKKVAKALSILFNMIEDENIEDSKSEYKKLSELLGDDDPAIVRAKTQLDFLEEANNNEANH